jgi:5-oxoprolinase (ATP-hydrolysing) subunit A
VSLTLEPFGDAAWRVRIPEGVNGRAILESLRALPGVIDAVVCERHALVAFDPAAPPPGVATAIERSIAVGAPATTPREHSIRVRYDGADLAEVARTTGLSPADVAARHASVRYAVASIGFLPGFAYLRGLDPRLVVPRRASPRARVPSQAVGIAGPYTGVYPFASPGGWSLIGTALEFMPFDPRSGAVLALGDQVRFVPVPS